MKNVTVIGAGIVGIATASYLQRDGHKVTVVDRAAPGEYCSFGNAGILSPGSCVPIAMPGIVWNVPGYLLDPIGPLRLKWSYFPRALPWLWRFINSTGLAQIEATADALRSLLVQTFDAHLPLARAAGCADLIRQSGYVVVYEDEQSYRGDALAWKLRRDRGVICTELDAAGIEKLVPALGRRYPRGLHLPEQGFVFCAFNNNHKMSEQVWRCWMRVLRQVEGSVLWLLADNPFAGQAEDLDANRARIWQYGLRNPFSGAFDGDGTYINSANDTVSLNGERTVAEAKDLIIPWLEARNCGEGTITYRLRDWLFSRQRYWGEPFPVVFLDDKPQTVTDAELPVALPDLDDFKPSGSPEGPLAKAGAWLEVTLPDGRRARRETNTMPQWAGSCWYYLRYIDPVNPQAFCESAKANAWLPVDLYIGGAEHAVLHLLYSRFWHKVLFDRGLLPCPEPFQKLINQGMILGEMEYTAFRKDGALVSGAQVDFDGKVATESA